MAGPFPALFQQVDAVGRLRRRATTRLKVPTAAPRQSWQDDIIANVAGGLDNAVVEHPSGGIVGFRMPIKSTPTSVPASGNEGIYQPAPNPHASGRRLNPEV